MPLAVAGKNLMLNALKGTNPGTPITHIGLLAQGTPLTSVTAVTSTDTFTKNGHGMSNGQLVVVTEKTGGTGITAGDAADANGLAEPLFVIGQTTNTFQLSRTSGGSAVDIATDISACTVIPLNELSGGSPAYARVALAFNNASDGAMDDSTNGATLDVPASTTVKYQSFHSASTAGTLLGLDRVTDEIFGAQGTYTSTDVDISL